MVVTMSMSMSMIEYGGRLWLWYNANHEQTAVCFGSRLSGPGSWLLALLSCSLLLVSGLLSYAHHHHLPPHQRTHAPPNLEPAQTPRIIHAKARKRPIPRQPLRTLALPALPAPAALRVVPVPVPVSAPPLAFAFRARRDASGRGHGHRGAVR